MKIHSNIRCPACKGPLVPTRMRCGACELTVAGTFASNEFATLGEEDLHFLRIFVLCEGRIRDMESALGVSYPTIKARMTQLKATLAARPVAPADAAAAPPIPAGEETGAVEVLKELEAGRISYSQAMERIKTLQKEPL